MPEIKLTLDDPAATVALLKEAARHAGGTGWDHKSAMHTDWLARQIESAQLPKAPVKEPTKFGSIVKARCESHSGLFWVRAGGGYWVSDHILETGLYCATWNLLDVIEVLRVGVGEPATPPAEAAKPCACVHSSTAKGSARHHNPSCPAHRTAVAEPTPEQVEADLAQDEQAHARYYTEGDAIEALVGAYAEALAHKDYSAGSVWLILREAFARVLEVGGQQSGVPVEKVREVAETLLSLADAPEYQEPKHADVNAVWRQAAQRVAALLPEEPTS